jgi:hypothetical protein
MLFLFLLINKKGSLHHRLPDVTRFMVIVQLSKTESDCQCEAGCLCHFRVTKVSPEVEALYTRRTIWRQEIILTFFFYLMKPENLPKMNAPKASRGCRITHQMQRPKHQSACDEDSGMQ